MDEQDQSDFSALPFSFVIYSKYEETARGPSHYSVYSYTSGMEKPASF